MSKRNFICFNCRIAVRTDPHLNNQVTCSQCGESCINLGYKIPVPPKNKPKEWDAIKKQLADEEIDFLEKRNKQRIQRKHEVEKEIKKLESKPENPGRKSLLKNLYQEKNQL